MEITNKHIAKICKQKFCKINKIKFVHYSLPYPKRKFSVKSLKTLQNKITNKWLSTSNIRPQKVSYNKYMNY